MLSYLPPANEVWGKVIFLHLFVILFTGGWYPSMHCTWYPSMPCSRGCVLSQHALQVVSQHVLQQGVPAPRGGEWSGGVCSQGVCLGGLLCGGDGLLLMETSPDGYCCGRYASYWNAFLFVFNLFPLLPPPVPSLLPGFMYSTPAIGINTRKPVKHLLTTQTVYHFIYGRNPSLVGW